MPHIVVGARFVARSCIFSRACGTEMVRVVGTLVDRGGPKCGGAAVGVVDALLNAGHGVVGADREVVRKPYLVVGPRIAREVVRGP